MAAFPFLWLFVSGKRPWEMPHGLLTPKKHSCSQVLELQPEMWLRQAGAVLILLNPSQWLTLVQES